MRIAAIQTDLGKSGNHIEQINNVRAIFENFLVESRRPDLILLPEIWGCGFFAFDKYKENAEDLYGDTISFMSEWAKNLKAHIMTGSFLEKAENNDGSYSLYNTSALIDPRGEVLGTYNKIHLFGYRSLETKLLKSGEAFCVVDTDFGKVGITTCYDLRFPEIYRMMLNSGTEIFLVCAAWPYERLNHWRLFNQVRALENQSFLISCNCAGTQNGVTGGGHSMICAPDGRIIAEGDEKPGVLFEDIDLSEIKRYREEFPVIKDRRF
ncbi:MAG: carbon-nitrogen family hydrolase [Lachnospiraceae bacterium]|jgi:predicted amidohydrolase|nr:carbon-nitrogen family hydrolase [Lachnospiraceae bacterium]